MPLKRARYLLRTGQAQPKRGTTAEWAEADPILDDGEFGYDEELEILKVGDGVSTWGELGTVGSPSGEDIADIVADAIGDGGALDLKLATSFAQIALGPGDGLLDFRNLPDGAVPTAAARGTFEGIWGGADLSDFSIEDGRLIPGAEAFNNYLEVGAAEKIQYMAVCFDALNPAPSSTQGVTFHIVAPGGWDATGSSVIHDQLYLSVGGAARTCGNFTGGPYNAPGAGPSVTSNANHTLAPAGRQGILVEFVHYLDTGLIEGYYEGVLLTVRQDANNPEHSGTTGMVQFNNGDADVRVQYIHVSPDIPAHLLKDAAKRVNKNGYTANTSLDNTWKKIHEFWVTGPESGVIEVSFSPLIESAGGKVQAAVGPASGLTPESYEQVILRTAGGAGNEAWVCPSWNKIYYVTPRLVQQLAIYMKTDGTATMRDIYGADPGNEGPRWQPVVEMPATAVS